MKTILCRKILPIDPPTHLHMEPESDRDHATCEAILSLGCAMGHGRDPATGRMLHMQMEAVANAGRLDPPPQ